MSTKTNAQIQREYAMALLEKNPNAVVVLPHVEDDGTISKESVVETGSKGFGYIQLFSRVETTEDRKGVEFTNVREHWCLHRGNAESLATKYPAGTILGGRIVTEEGFAPTNPNNLLQDLKYMSAVAREMNLVSMGVDGEGELHNIYQQKYWDRTGTVGDIIIPTANREDIVAKTATETAKRNDAQKAIEAQKAARIAALQAKATKTPKEKAELESLLA